MLKLLDIKQMGRTSTHNVLTNVSFYETLENNVYKYKMSAIFLNPELIMDQKSLLILCGKLDNNLFVNYLFP
jgi:hypothetical protein